MAEKTLYNLRDTLAQISRKVQQIRERNESIGEQNTKAVLIDPVLSALGWNLAELDEVRREYRRKPPDNPVDYALFIHRSPRLFVEAKDLSANLSDRKWISQTLGYATMVGVKWCVLTNGDEYRLYNAHAPMDVEQKLFRVVRVSQDSQREYAIETLELLSKAKMEQDLISGYWREYVVDHSVEASLRDLLLNDDTSLIRLIRKRAPELSPSEIRESLRRANIRISFPTLASPPLEASKPSSTPLVLQGGQEGGPHTLPDTAGVELKDLIRAGFVRPPLLIEKEYKGVRFEATIREDGKVAFAGQVYGSLSVSAAMARKSVIGAPPGKAYPNTNGWTFWKYHDPETGRLERLDRLRQRCAEESVPTR